MDYRVCPDAVPPVEFNVGGAIQGEFIPGVFQIGDGTGVGTGALVIAALIETGHVMGRDTFGGSLSSLGTTV